MYYALSRLWVVYKQTSSRKITQAYPHNRDYCYCYVIIAPPRIVVILLRRLNSDSYIFIDLPLTRFSLLLTTHFMAHFHSLLLLLLCCILIVVMRKIVQNVGTKIHLLSCKPYIKVWYLISYRRMRHLWFLYRWSLTHFPLFEYSNTWCASNDVIHRIHTFISWYTMKYNSAKLYSIYTNYYLQSYFKKI